MKNVRQVVVFLLTVTSLLSVPAIIGENNLPSSTPSHVLAGKVSAARLGVNVSPLGTASVTTTRLSNNPNSTDWTIDSPTWTLENGYLDGSGLNGTLSPIIQSTGIFSTNRTVEVDFRTTSVGSKAYYTAQIAGKYADFYHKAVLGVLAGAPLGMSVFSGATVDNYPSNTILDPTQWYHAKIVFAGNHVTAYLNGTLYLNFTDPIIGQLGGCGISLASWGDSESQFNNATIAGSVLPDESPTADFSFSPSRAAPGQTVAFDGTLSSEPDGYITNFAWTFGDGSTGIGPFPTHVYNLDGNYTVTLMVTDASGQTATALQTIPIVSPTLIASPTGGPIGTKVLVHGSNFPVLIGSYAVPTTVDVTFDDQFVGFTTTTDGTFTFVFNVPLAQPGQHEIQAVAELYPTPVKASTGFTVTSQPLSEPSLAVSVAPLYFPGDTATIYVLSSQNGSPAQAQTVSLTLILPNGTSRNLALSAINTGLYRSTYAIPATGAIGTYALFATSSNGNTNTTALANFEVKPTWLQANGRNVMTATSILGVVGTVSFLGVAWRKGYFTKKKDEFSLE